MINCDICQVANDDALLFCKDCGGRLKRPSPAPAAEVSPAPAVQAPQAPKPKLRSPILGGGGDDDFEEEPVRPVSKGKTKSSKGLRSPMLGGADDDFDQVDEQPVKKGKGGLRSPMLGGSGADDDFDEPEEPTTKRGKGGLRSPILGSGGDDQAKPKGRKGGLRSPILGGAADLDDDDDDDDYQPSPKGRGLRSPILGGGDKHPKHDIEFPHRHNDLPPPDEHESPGRPGKSRGLRSPLLGGDDGDFEEMPSIEAARPHGTSQSGRLRSPILGGGSDYIDDDYEEEDEVKPDDPTALRSPLLAVRAPRAEKPKAEPPAPAQPVAPQPQQVAPQVQPPAPVQQMAPAPQAPLPSPTATGNSFTSFDPSASQTQMAAMPAPTQAPRYQPQPAPKPTNTNYNLGTPGQTLVNLDPAPAHNFNAPPAVPPAPLAPAPAAPAPADKPAADNQGDTGRKLGRSRLLGDSSAAGDDDEDDFSIPKDRRGRPDRRVGQRSGRRSIDIDSSDDQDDVTSPGFPARPQAANPMAPLVMALVGVALLGKIWYVMTFGASIFQSGLPVLADQLATIVLIIGAMMMALKK